MKKKLLFSLLTISTIGILSQDCSDVFISEYLEGKNNNKAIELYNPTATVKSLNNYKLQRYSNGSNAAGPSYTLDLSGISINPYDVYVIVIDKRDTAGIGQEIAVDIELQSKADAFMCPDYNVNSVMYFNGNDALVLSKTNGLVDVFGKVGEDPIIGWPLNDSIKWTINHALIRKSSVTKGQINDIPFIPSVEWDSLSYNFYDSLGTHDCICKTIDVDENITNNINIEFYPNPTKNVLNIKADNNINKIIINDIYGKIIHDYDNINNEFSIINISDMEKGIYIIDIILENNIHTSRKLIKN